MRVTMCARPRPGMPGPVTKWKPEQFFDTAPLEAVLKDIGKR